MRRLALTALLAAVLLLPASAADPVTTGTAVVKNAAGLAGKGASAGTKSAYAAEKLARAGDIVSTWGSLGGTTVEGVTTLTGFGKMVFDIEGVVETISAGISAVEGVNSAVKTIDQGFDMVTSIYNDINDVVYTVDSWKNIYTYVTDTYTYATNTFTTINRRLSEGDMSYHDYYNITQYLRSIISGTYSALNSITTVLGHGLNTFERLNMLRQVETTLRALCLKARKAAFMEQAVPSMNIGSKTDADGSGASQDALTVDPVTAVPRPAAGPLNSRDVEENIREGVSGLNSQRVPWISFVWVLLGVTGLALLGFNTWRYFRGETRYGSEDAYIRIGIGLVLAALLLALLSSAF